MLDASVDATMNPCYNSAQAVHVHIHTHWLAHSYTQSLWWWGGWGTKSINQSNTYIQQNYVPNGKIYGEISFIFLNSCSTYVNRSTMKSEKWDKVLQLQNIKWGGKSRWQPVPKGKFASACSKPAGLNWKRVPEIRCHDRQGPDLNTNQVGLPELQLSSNLQRSVFLEEMTASEGRH